MEVQYYMVQIISSLKYLHANKVIHREYFFILIQPQTWEPFLKLKYGDQTWRLWACGKTLIQ